jgi:hypothetical protein
MRLESPERFQTLCARLARRVFPDAIPVAFASWDGGRDIIRLAQYDGDTIVHDVVWQAKFTDRLNSTTRQSICRLAPREFRRTHAWGEDSRGSFAFEVTARYSSVWSWLGNDSSSDSASLRLVRCRSSGEISLTGEISSGTVRSLFHHKSPVLARLPSMSHLNGLNQT